MRRSALAAIHCDACFTGDYPLTGTEDADGKYSLEEPLLPLVGA